MKVKKVDVRNRLYRFRELHPKMKKLDIFLHFKLEGISRSTVYMIIKQYDDKIPLVRKPGSGRIAKKMTKAKLKQLKTFLDHTDSKSTIKAAKKFNVSHQYISILMREKLQIKNYSKEEVSYRSDVQIARIISNCRFLEMNFRFFDFVLDDESYFTLTNSNLMANRFYKSSNKEETPNSVKFKKRKKFETKILVWAAISNKGISRLYYRESGYAINADVYKDECIVKRLIPFIEKNHSEHPYVFWPDMAACHYAPVVREALEAKNVIYVPKIKNVPATPEVRCIENFWAILKDKVYANNWQAENTQKLKQRISFCVKEIDIALVRMLCDSTISRLRKIRDNGVPGQ